MSNDMIIGATRLPGNPVTIVKPTDDLSVQPDGKQANKQADIADFAIGYAMPIPTAGNDWMYYNVLGKGTFSYKDIGSASVVIKKTASNDQDSVSCNDWTAEASYAVPLSIFNKVLPKSVPNLGNFGLGGKFRYINFNVDQADASIPSYTNFSGELSLLVSLKNSAFTLSCFNLGQPVILHADEEYQVLNNSFGSVKLMGNAAYATEDKKLTEGGLGAEGKVKVWQYDLAGRFGASYTGLWYMTGGVGLSRDGLGFDCAGYFPTRREVDPVISLLFHVGWGTIINTFAGQKETTSNQAETSSVKEGK